MSWLTKISVLEHSKSGDEEFETGRPVEFRHLRYEEPAPNMGERFQQHIEPAGKYIIQNENDSSYIPPKPWSTGKTSFSNPLVLPFNLKPNNSTYDEHSWKMQLYNHYGKTGLELSWAIIEDGYDGIVTIYIDDRGQPTYTKEIVDLRPIIEVFK